MRSYCLGISLIFLLHAGIADASVSINEVAWMGSTASANHEWIELYNSGEAVSVDGWVLSDGMNLNINLTGTITSGNYAVLERTSDDSAAGTAFLIYTGALVNTGATLTLKDGNGGIVDQVAGGENWQNIGGDNVTKETAQYTQSGWVTDAPTPGAVNGTGRVSPPPSSGTPPASGGSSSSGQAAAARKVESVNLKNPETKLTLKIEAQSIGYVNQPVPFYVTASGLDENSQRTVFYEWNFGDSYQDDGKRLSHQYSYPGEYLVTVFARKDKNEQTATHKITILPVNFSLSLNSAGDVQIHNNSAYDVDLSGYSLKGSREVVFPPRSVVLAKATITVAGSRLKTTYQDIVMLYDGNRNVIASTLPKLVVAEPLLGSVVEAKKTTQSFSSPPRAQTTNSTFNTTPSEPEAEAAVILDLPTEEELLADQDFSPTPEPNPDSDSRNVRWPYLALIGLILIAYGAIFFGRKGNSSNQ